MFVKKQNKNHTIILLSVQIQEIHTEIKPLDAIKYNETFP